MASKRPDDLPQEERPSGRKPMQYSRLFRKHFEGWEEHEVMVSAGKFRTEWVYVGDYYVYQGTKTKKWCLGAGYLVLLAGMLVCFFRASTDEIRFNSTWYAAAAQTIVLLGSLWLLVSVLQWLFAPVRMTAGEYRSGPRALLHSSLALAAANGLAAALAAIHLAVYQGTDAGDMLLSAALYLAGGGMIWLLRCIEKSNVYVQIEQ